MSRPPPGSWRLLAPALLGWAASAWAVTVPGTGWWLSLVSGVCGAVSIAAVLITVRWERENPSGSVSSLSRRNWSLVALSCATLVILGSQVNAGEWRRSDPVIASAAEQREPLALRVTVVSFAAGSSAGIGERFWLRASAHSARGVIPVLLWLDGRPDKRWVPGATLDIAGIPERLEPGSSAAYGVTVIDSAGAQPVGSSGVFSLSKHAGQIASDLRLRLREATERLDGAALLPGFAVGDASLVGEELRGYMLASSLTHLTAVSGANCALVTSSILWVSSWLGAGRRVRLILASVALLGFVYIVGPDPSVQRAAVMAGVVLVSGYGGKRAVALPSLGVAVLFLLVIDPWQALQPGFALSVVATAGIIIAVPALCAGLQRRLRVPRMLALPIAMALAAQIACGPFLLLLQPGIPVAGILANVIAAPAAPLGTGLGLLAMLLLPVSEPAGLIVLHLAAISARWVAATAEVSARLPLARWNWPEGWGGALLLAVVQALLFIAWAIHTGRLKWPGRWPVVLRSPWQQASAKPRRARAAVAVLGCAAAGTFVGVTLVVPLTERGTTPRDWAVVACDVGQGDAILLRDPTIRDSTMLVDTGDDPQLIKDCLSRFGVRRISLLVLTHDDQDHVGALSEVAGITDAAMVSPPSAEDGDLEADPTGRGSRDVLRELEQYEIPYRVGTAGLHSGDGGVVWEVLAPQTDQLPSDTNEASLVMLVQAGGISILMLGDTGEEEHRALLARETELGVDVVKVAHHGSRDQDPRLLEAAGAKLGLISVGATNRYGHPTHDALESLKRAGTVPLRTDELGSIALSSVEGEIRAWSERAPGERASPNSNVGADE